MRHIRGIIKEMNLKKRDQKFYWKLPGKLQSQKNDVFKQLIPGEKWNNHFKNILINKQRTSEFPSDSLEPGSLDYPITENELNEASYIIRPGKASGYDSVSNEMILGLIEVNPGLRW